MNLKDITLVSFCGNSKFLIDIIKAAKICMQKIKFGDVKILSNTHVAVKDINVIKIRNLDKLEYCKFSMYDLPSFINTEYCLTFQGDGFIINPELWTNDFLNYDYIGAPWLSEVKNRVGNGGFSLRSKKFLYSAKTLEYNSDIQFQKHIPAGQLVTPEDWFLCCYSYEKMLDLGVKFADITTAYKFSVEHPSPEKWYDRFDINTYQSFGFHGSFNKAAMKLLERAK